MPAERLYYENPGLCAFSATVVDTGVGPDGPWVTLSRTAFYPTSGGQPNDLGTVCGIPVRDVFEDSNEVFHVLSRTPGVSPGQEVHCVVDQKRRFDLMQQHLGQHILSSAFEKIMDADTVGFHLTENSLTVDLTALSLSEEQVGEVEHLANEIVWEDRKVMSTWPSEAELLTMPLRKPPARSDGIRVIVVDGFDWSACGGTHPERTGQVGLIKVLSWEKVKAGVRVSFACGQRALDDYREKHRVTKALSNALSAPATEVLPSVQKLMDQAQAQYKQIETMARQLMQYESEALLGSGDHVIARFYETRDIQDLKTLAAMVVSAPNRVFIAGASFPSPQVIVARSDSLAIDARQLIEVAKSVLGARGGGNPKISQAGGGDPGLVEKAIAAVEAAARASLA